MDADPVPGAIQKTVGNVQDGKFEYGPGNLKEIFLTPLFFYCRLKGFIYEFLLIIFVIFIKLEPVPGTGSVTRIIFLFFYLLDPDPTE